MSEAASVRTVQIRNHTRSVLDFDTSAKVEGKPFVLLLGGSDGGAAVRSRKASEGAPYLDNRVEVPVEIWAKIKGDRVLAAMVESGDLEVIGGVLV